MNRAATKGPASTVGPERVRRPEGAHCLWEGVSNSVSRRPLNEMRSMRPDPVITKPQALARETYPDRPWVWLLPDDPYWADPPRLWRTEAPLLIYAPRDQSIAGLLATIAAPGQQPASDEELLPIGTVLLFEARQLSWFEDPHINGPSPDDVILVRLVDGRRLMLRVGYNNYNGSPTVAAAAACVPDETSRRLSAQATGRTDP